MLRWCVLLASVVCALTQYDGTQAVRFELQRDRMVCTDRGSVEIASKMAAMRRVWMEAYPGQAIVQVDTPFLEMYVTTFVQGDYIVFDNESIARMYHDANPKTVAIYYLHEGEEGCSTLMML